MEFKKFKKLKKSVGLKKTGKSTECNNIDKKKEKQSQDLDVRVPTQGKSDLSVTLERLKSKHQKEIRSSREHYMKAI